MKLQLKRVKDRKQREFKREGQKRGGVGCRGGMRGAKENKGKEEEREPFVFQKSGQGHEVEERKSHQTSSGGRYYHHTAHLHGYLLN